MTRERHTRLSVDRAMFRARVVLMRPALIASRIDMKESIIDEM
jgi:hypothetical protein